MDVDYIIPTAVSGAEFIAKMTGEPYIPPKAYYTVDGKEYWHVFFGIAFPNMELPGAVVSVAIRKEIDDPELVVRDLATENDIMALFQSGDDIRQKYQTKGGKLGQVWYGEPGRFDELRAEFNKPYRKFREDRVHLVIIGSPDGGETADSGTKYLTTLLDLGRANRIKFMPGCEALRTQLEIVLTDKKKSTIASFDPMIMALGFACRAIMVQKPWRQRSPKPKPPADKDLWAKGKSPWKMALKRKKISSGMFGKGGQWI